MAEDDGLAALKARLRDWIAAHHSNDRRFAQRSGLSEATVRRLVQLPRYRSTRDTWRVVARTCGWSEDEVLGLAGWAVPPDRAAPWGWALVSQGLTQLGVPVARQEALRVAWDLDLPDPAPARSSSARSAGR